MQLTELLAHSPLGGSGAYRWMVCPGSVKLSAGVQDSESEYASEGTTAHSVGEWCITHGLDAWELMQRGDKPGDGYTLPDGEELFVSKDMADAVQVYLNAVRAHPDQNQGNTFVEKAFHCPTLHELYYGKADFVYTDAKNRVLHVYDYKHGAGIVVDVQWNPQCMYYGAGILEELQLWTEIDVVTLHIVQPRGWHSDGPLRKWSIKTTDLEKWLDGDLIPSMKEAMVSRETKSGEHCRFCPARGRACPQLIADFKELEELMTIMNQKGGAKALTNAELSRFLSTFNTAKIAAKAATETAFARLQSGKQIKGFKIVHSRTNREWKDGAERALKKEFGDEALSTPALLSPAKIDGLPGGSDATARWAFKPTGGLAVAAESDARSAVGKDTKSLFKNKEKK